MPVPLVAILAYPVVVSIVAGLTTKYWAEPYVDTVDYAFGRGEAAGGTKGKGDFPKYYSSGKVFDPAPDPGYTPGQYPPTENGDFRFSKSFNEILGDLRYVLPIAILGGVYLKYRGK